ncbi:MAG: MFS transporter, partial [Deltaproteobacteria bacterium]|nr:MFS transporter [Deltaproteobacteria bacterium]
GETNTAEGNPGSGNQAFTLEEAVFTRQFWMLSVVMMCYGFCFFSIQVHIAPYITDAGISAASAANILAAVGGTAIIGQIVLGGIADRIGNKQAFFIGVVLLGIAGVGLMQTKALWGFYLFACILGLAFGDLSTQESPIVAWLFGLESHGLIFGFSSFSFTIGAAIGPVFFGYIFDTTGSYQFAFLICIFISIVSIILTICLKPTAAESAPVTGSAKVI